MQARAGMQQGLFTGDDPIWLPFPVASVAAALLAVLGAGAALVKRDLDRLRPARRDLAARRAALPQRGRHLPPARGTGPASSRQTKSPILRPFDTADGRAVMVNLSGTERWRELCRLLGHGRRRARLLDARRPLQALRQGVEPGQARRGHRAASASRTADEWEAALLESPAAVAKCNTLAEWLASEQARVERAGGRDATTPCWGGCRWWARPCGSGAEPGERRPGRRHGGEQGALGGHRIVDLSSFWAGPLASRLLAELGADVVKVEPPGGEGGFQMMPVLPNIYVDGNRSKRGLVLDLKAPSDRARLLDLVAASDVVVENAMAGAWERLGLDEAALRAVNPALVYARAKGFGVAGPLAAPAFVRLRGAGGDRHGDDPGRRAAGRCRSTSRPTTTGRGCCWGPGSCCALLGRARGAAVTRVEASLALTATLFQSEDVARLAVDGAAAADVDRVGGADLRGPSVWRHLYRAKDGWVMVCCVTVAPDGAAAGVGCGGRAAATSAVRRRRRRGGGGRDA